MGVPARKDAAAVAKQQVGYDPDALDECIRKYRGEAERNLKLCEALAPRVEDAIAKLKDVQVIPGTELDHANTITTLYDRMSKAGLNVVKALDELSRLRSFASGGPDTRPDLTVASEIELRAILLAGIQSLGITDLKELEG